MTDDRRSDRRRYMILLCVVLGLAIAASQAIGGNTKGAISNLAVYAAIIAWFALGKSDFLDTVLQVDERQKHIVDKARQATGVTMAYVLVGWSIYNFMHGNFSGPIVILAVATGGVFFASVVFYHYRT
jgi:hypothetical protein